jgi:hypothetical protein
MERKPFNFYEVLTYFNLKKIQFCCSWKNFKRSPLISYAHDILYQSLFTDNADCVLKNPKFLITHPRPSTFLLPLES